MMKHHFVCNKLIELENPEKIFYLGIEKISNLYLFDS
jgi:hypothetical protein